MKGYERNIKDARAKWDAWKEEFKEYEGEFRYSRVKDYGDTITCCNEGGNVKVEFFDDGSVVYTWSDGGGPVLILNSKPSNLGIGDCFEFGEYKFKIISNMYALCETVIGKCAFRKDWRAEDANIYEKSDVKEFVDNWFDNVLFSRQYGDNFEANVWSGW